MCQGAGGRVHSGLQEAAGRLLASAVAATGAFTAQAGRTLPARLHVTPVHEWLDAST